MNDANPQSNAFAKLKSSRSNFSRRRFLAMFLSLAAYLKLVKPTPAANLDDNEVVLEGRWLLKRSDLR